jgi:hypothetical protein
MKQCKCCHLHKDTFVLLFDNVVMLQNNVIESRKSQPNNNCTRILEEMDFRKVSLYREVHLDHVKYSMRFAIAQTLG